MIKSSFKTCKIFWCLFCYLQWSRALNTPIVWLIFSSLYMIVYHFVHWQKKKKKKKPFSKAMLLFIQHIYCKHTALYTASLTRFFFKEFTIIFFFKHKSMKFHLLCLELPDRRLSITILCHYEFLVIASLLLDISTYYGYSFLRH